MSDATLGARIPYYSVRDVQEAPLRFRWLRRASGRLSLGRIALVLGVVVVALPVILASIYYIAIASPRFISESRFAVRTTVEAPTLDLGIGLTGSEPGTGGVSGNMPGLGGVGGTGGLGGLGGLAGGITGAGSTNLQDTFVVASYLMSPEMTQRLDKDGWLRERLSRPDIDPLSRLAEGASHEELFAQWRRLVSAAVDRRSNVIQLHVRAYSARDAQTIASRAIAISEEMIADLTKRQREDTLALARTELAEAEARYEAVGLQLRQLRRASRIVDPAREAEAAGISLLRLLRERIKTKTELETLKRLAGERAPGIAELKATIAGLDPQIEAANKRLTGNAHDSTILAAVAALEEVELERRFAQVMLNLATSVFDRAQREAEHRASFILVYLEPTLPSEAREPRVLISIAFVAALASIAWLFAMTATAIALDQLD